MKKMIQVAGAILATIVFGFAVSVTFAATTAESHSNLGVEVEHPLDIEQLDGTVVTVPPGIYAIERVGKSSIRLTPSKGEPVDLDAHVGKHNQSINEPQILVIESAEDKVHITFLLVGGKSLNVAASMSEISTRGRIRSRSARRPAALRQVAIPKYQAATAADVQKQVDTRRPGATSSDSRTLGEPQLVQAKPTYESVKPMNPTTAEAKKEQAMAALEDYLNDHHHATLTDSGVNQVIRTFSTSSFLSFNSCSEDSRSWKMEYRTSGGPLRRSPLTRPLAGGATYLLNEDEMKRTEMSSWSGIPWVAEVSGGIRTNKARACIHNWRATDWRGEVDNGRLIIMIRMGSEQISTVPTARASTDPMIKTLRMYQYKVVDIPSFFPAFFQEAAEATIGVGTWKDYPMFTWSNPFSDMSIRDLHNVGGRFVVSLIPEAVDGQLTYSVGDVQWVANAKVFAGSHDTREYPDQLDFQLFTKVPELESAIERYNEQSIDSGMRSFVATVFEHQSVKSTLSNQLTAYVKRNAPNDIPLRYLIPRDDRIEVVFARE